MFVSHRKHTFGSPRPVTGIALPFTYTAEMSNVDRKDELRIVNWEIVVTLESISCEFILMMNINFSEGNYKKVCITSEQGAEESIWA
jgi:hypothetical protein